MANIEIKLTTLKASKNETDVFTIDRGQHTQPSVKVDSIGS